MVVLKLILMLVATILIELGMLLLMGERRRKVLLSSVVINILTNIPLNLFLMYVSDGIVEMVVGEALVIVIETFWYYCFIKNLGQATIYGILCNVASLLCGFLFQLIL